MNDQPTTDKIVEELFRKAPELIPRKMLSEIIGGIISVKSFANLDSEGCGIRPRMLVGRRIAYPKSAAISWLKQRCKIEEGNNEIKY